MDHSNLKENSEMGYPISRAEALRLAEEIIGQAERERVEVADREAACGIRYDDEHRAVARLTGC